MPPSLSLTVIMRDEEVHVRQLLSTAHLYADEIVVVDTGSTDRTKEEAAKYTTQVHDFVWCDDFSAARNYGIERCTKDFVMWLDADDVVREEDAHRIRSLISQGVSWDVVILPYHTSHDASGRTTNFTRRERIFRNRRGFAFQYPIHECLKYPDNAVIDINDTINVHHFNLKRREPSNVRNLRILTKAVEGEYRRDFRMWWLLAAEEAPEKSILYYRKVLQEFSHLLEPSLQSEICVQFARKLITTGRADEALQVLGRAIILFPLWREPYFCAGQVLWQGKRYPEALQMIQIAGTIPPPARGIANLDSRIYDGDEYYEWLFLAHYQLNDKAGMQRAIERGLAQNPANARLLEWRQTHGKPEDRG